MSHVTAAQVSDWINMDFDAAARTRVENLIRTAERYVTRRAGWDFFQIATPESDQSKDWIEVVCRVVEKMFLNDSIGRRKHIAGPYQSERNADYQYTLKSGNAAADLYDDAHVSGIIAFWQSVQPLGSFLEVEGPNEHGNKYDPEAGMGHIEGSELDVSRLTLDWPEE